MLLWCRCGQVRRGSRRRRCCWWSWRAIMPEQSNDYRVVVFGAGGVGKSSLVLRFVRGTFRDTYVPTIEDTYRQVISCNKQVRPPRRRRRRRRHASFHSHAAAVRPLDVRRRPVFSTPLLILSFFIAQSICFAYEWALELLLYVHGGPENSAQFLYAVNSIKY